MGQKNYQELPFTTAEELLRAVTPMPVLKTGTPYPRFIFRGQPDAEWELVPSALRQRTRGDATTDALRLIDPQRLEPTWDGQVFAEFHLLRLFIEACDRSVIPVPGDSFEFRKAWMDDQIPEVSSAYRFPSRWPFPAHLSALAFAQHHGIPTRLLDWSHSAIVAAYFAAAGVLGEKQPSTGCIALWALNIELLHIYPAIEVVQMPGAHSERLGAQRALFTVLRDQQVRGTNVRATSLDAALASSNEDRFRPKPLWKLTLPKSEALRLVYLCHINGVDAAAVYPNAEGAARATKEQLAWLRTDPRTGRNATDHESSAGVSG